MPIAFNCAGHSSGRSIRLSSVSALSSAGCRPRQMARRCRVLCMPGDRGARRNAQRCLSRRAISANERTLPEVSFSNQPPRACHRLEQRRIHLARQIVTGRDDNASPTPRRFILSGTKRDKSRLLLVRRPAREHWTSIRSVTVMPSSRSLTLPTISTKAAAASLSAASVRSSTPIREWL